MGGKPTLCQDTLKLVSDTGGAVFCLAIQTTLAFSFQHFWLCDLSWSLPQPAVLGRSRLRGAKELRTFKAEAHDRSTRISI